jgi:hypothetical protein
MFDPVGIMGVKLNFKTFPHSPIHTVSTFSDLLYLFLTKAGSLYYEFNGDTGTL